MKKTFLLFTLAANLATAAPIEFNQFDNSQQEADYQLLIQTQPSQRICVLKP